MPTSRSPPIVDRSKRSRNPHYRGSTWVTPFARQIVWRKRSSAIAARQIAPADHKILVNLSVALRDLRKLDEATACLDEVLRISPDLPEARFDKSLIELMRGNLARGWDEYEWRLRHEPDARPNPHRRWEGTSPAGGSILIVSEQGIGDEVMFASCLADFAAGARSCFVECDPRLVHLFARSFPGIQPIAKPAGGLELPAVGPIDAVEYLGSLPRHTRRQVEDFPQLAGYLKPDTELVEKWRSRLARLGGALKVGISWRRGKRFRKRGGSDQSHWSFGSQFCRCQG